jgi:hypothetical protein
MKKAKKEQKPRVTIASLRKRVAELEGQLKTTEEAYLEACRERDVNADTFSQGESVARMLISKNTDLRHALTKATLVMPKDHADMLKRYYDSVLSDEGG